MNTTKLPMNIPAAPPTVIQIGASAYMLALPNHRAQAAAIRRG
jgi:hypothetical protein